VPEVTFSKVALKPVNHACVASSRSTSGVTGTDGWESKSNVQTFLNTVIDLIGESIE
jgi:hypothetical protein